MSEPSERFWQRVEPEPNSGCWLWMGSRNADGYGEFWLNGKKIGAHRAAWILANGHLPGGAFVLHRCDNPPCVWLGHLFLGDAGLNLRDAWQKGRHRNLPPDLSGRGHHLNLADVLEIRQRADRATQKSLASEYGVTQSMISKIVTRNVWKKAT